MGKIQLPLLATTTQKGIVQVGSGLLSTPGIIDAVRPIAELWVARNGSDSTGSGAMGNPFATLTHAFAFITANPLAGGYTVHMPAGVWQEAVSMPPATTRLIGQGMLSTVLIGISNAQLQWVEDSAGIRCFSDLRLHADITGIDNGDLMLVMLHADMSGVITLAGYVDMDSCAGTYNFVNCLNVHVRNPYVGSSTDFQLTYDPTAGTNGSGAVVHDVAGGVWQSLSYDSQDASVPLCLHNVRATSLITKNAGKITTDTTVATNLTATDASSVIEYAGPANESYPVYHGNGSFKSSELLLKKIVLANTGPGNLVLTLPKQVGDPVLKSIFSSTDFGGIVLSYVSNTASTLTLFAEAPATHPTYEIRVLVRP